MVVIAEGFLQTIETKAIKEALSMQPSISLKSFRRYVDDSHARFANMEDADKFHTVLNNQNQHIEYTIERENEEKDLEFLDILIMNKKGGKYEFNVFRKRAITNVQIKPSSGHDPRIINGVFKGFVHRAINICSKKHIDKEIDFLINVFVENGYHKKHLQRIVNEIKTKMSSNEDPSENIPMDKKNVPTVTLPWIPGVSTKLRKAYKKAGYRIAFKSNPNLQTILTSKNKTQLPKNSYPGVYKIPCNCNNVPPYIGQTKLKINTRTSQHKEYVRKEQWERSGIAQHARTCQQNPNFEATKTIKIEFNTFNRRVRESLEIQKHQSGPQTGGMNNDDGMYVKTTFWLPYLREMKKLEDRQTHQNRRGPHIEGRNYGTNEDNTVT